MPRLRFTTAFEVLEAFPQARADIGVDFLDGEPLACLDALAAGETPDAALCFCAYLLPRREAVWWGCRSARLLSPSGPLAGAPALVAAEAWVGRPDDASRRAALECGMTSDLASPLPWLALAAGWAGGSMSPGDHAVAAPPHLTAKAVRAALLLLLARVDPKRRLGELRSCLATGRQIAAGVETIPAGPR